MSEFLDVFEEEAFRPDDDIADKPKGRPRPSDLFANIRYVSCEEYTTRRKRSSFRERTSPCQCCGFPLTQRHHLLEISEFGENGLTIRLCATCHEIYHLIRSRSKTSQAIIGTLVKDHWERVRWLHDLEQFALGERRWILTGGLNKDRQER